MQATLDIIVNSTNDSRIADSKEEDEFFGGIYVHPHWRQYRELIDSAPPAFLYSLGAFITVVGFLGIIGNLTVIWIFLRNSSLRTPNNWLVVNLAICDLSFSAVNGFPLMAVSCFRRKWIWGSSACQFYSYATGISGFGSINSLAAISIDRYLVITHPFRSWKKASWKRSTVLIVASWTWAILWATPPMMGWSRFILEGFGVSCTFDYLTRTPSNIAFNYCIIGFGFVQQLVIIGFCYFKIVRTVMKNRHDIFGVLHYEHRHFSARYILKTEKDVQLEKQELKMAKIVAVSVATFVVCWLPYALITVFGINGLDRLVTPYTTELPVMFAKTSAIWNPIIYALSHPRYRTALRRLEWNIVSCGHSNVAVDDLIPVGNIRMQVAGNSS